MTTDSRRLKKWEELEIGEETCSSPRTVTQADMIAFADRYDPQFFHNDPVAARDSLFGELVASGIYTAALWRIMDHEVNGDIDWVCGVQWDHVRWRRAVRARDTLVARSKLTSKRPSESRPGVGLAVLDHWVENQDGEVVFSFTSTDLVYRRTA
ncbi:MaoC/PaaZ C-terminal domain-containing protein [Hoeflea poritis]|uniref:MaoC/PaaZ C-terminal domain-containing protein n=1 Tax=Hoeflea poritis TaxID=2993659 RepID=A0ABT4VK79_9HYPH|nr:MaoC/PaaZ C-terminal domain-containing protein [Hoeflea poritis]MDA4845112.1 MaoC/PaaZ C-terminal domain-containing protein [Hoeflea poritis]